MQLVLPYGRTFCLRESWNFECSLTSDLPHAEGNETELLIERLLICRCGSTSNIRLRANTATVQLPTEDFRYGTSEMIHITTTF